MRNCNAEYFNYCNSFNVFLPINMPNKTNANNLHKKFYSSMNTTDPFIV